MTNIQVIKELIRTFFEDDERSEEFNKRYRKWPFMVWVWIGVVAGLGSILLPPPPDSPHFIDPSVKMIMVMGIFMVLSFKYTVKVAKKEE